MSVDLDMNSNRIYNLPTPVSDFEPLRLIDASEFIAPITALAVPTVTPEMYGAAGDGVSDDTIALRACIAGAGAGGVIVLKGGATYLISGSLALLSGQTIIANGATIKRAAQPTPTTVTGAVSASTGSVVLPLASIAGLIVGMSLVAAKAGVTRANLVAESTLSTRMMTITAINGLNVTVAAGPTFSLSSGDVIVNAFPALQLASNCVVQNLFVNGNSASRSWARWETDQEIVTVTGSANCLIQKNTIQNACSEAIYINGNYHTVRDNNVSNARNNGIHLSGAVHPVVAGNRFITGNLDLACGHSDGAIVWSNSITDAIVSDNFVSAFLAGIGSFDATDTDATIVGNTIRDCYCWGIYTAGAAARAIIADNRIVNCATNTSLLSGYGLSSFGGIFGNSLTSVDMQIDRNQLDGPLYISGSGAQARLSVRANIIRGTATSSFTGLTDFAIEGNIFLAPVKVGNLWNGRFSQNEINIAGNVATYALNPYIGTLSNVAIDENIIIGGLDNIYVSSGLTLSNLTVARNKCSDGKQRGIQCDTTSGVLSIIGNEVTADSHTVGADWIGIMNSLAGANIVGNCLFNNTGGDVSVGIYLPSGNSKTLIKDNSVRGPFSSSPISLSSTGALVANNAVQGSVYDGTGTNTISGTITL